MVSKSGLQESHGIFFCALFQAPRVLMPRAPSNGFFGFDRASKKESPQGRGTNRYYRLLAGIT